MLLKAYSVYMLITLYGDRNNHGSKGEHNVYLCTKTCLILYYMYYLLVVSAYSIHNCDSEMCVQVKTVTIKSLYNKQGFCKVHSSPLFTYHFTLFAKTDFLRCIASRRSINSQVMCGRTQLTYSITSFQFVKIHM